jgi:integrase/recombinase XerD
LDEEKVEVMKVQRVRLTDDSVTWIVLDDDHSPVQPILAYLKYLKNLDRSPNTIRATAHRLKLFWEYLRDEQLCWKEMDVAQLAAFIPWLRRLDGAVVSIAPNPAKRTNATIDLTLGAVYGLYSYHMRLGTIPQLPLYTLAVPHRGRYKPFLHGIAKSKPETTRVVSVKPEHRLPKTLTNAQVQRLLDACTHLRDRFLLALMFETGMRIGQCLGLTHADLSVEDGTLQIVPRTDNPNGARAKMRSSKTIPLPESLLHLYTDYLVHELCALEIEALPDFVFVNLFEGEIGHPMTYAAVRSLCKRLARKTSIPFTPHMFRHTRATTWIKEDQVPLPVVSRLLTHTSIQTTNDIYLQLTPEDLRAALAEGKGVRDAGGRR